MARFKIRKINIQDVDIHFDFTTDCNYWQGFWERNDGLGSGSDDPDAASPTLRQYHQALWSKELPCGSTFKLEFGRKSDYLKYNNMRLASDSITTGFRYKRNRKIIEEVARKLDYRPWMEDNIRRTYSIGGMMIFPKHRNSINGQRGMNPFICDRWDLTLECIRLYYEKNTDMDSNPLGWVLEADRSYFDLFGDFEGFCKFFFLDDCVSDDYSSVKMWIPCNPFQKKYPLPETSQEYMMWMDASLQFVEKRNKRIMEYIMRRVDE